MLTLSKYVRHCLSYFSPLLSPVSALSPLFAVGFTLLLLTAPAYAAEITLAWDDPNNDPAEVGGYNLYYWQLDWDAPAHINVGKKTTYTLTGLEAGETYYFAVTAHDGNSGAESDFSNVVDTNGTIFAVNVGGPEYVDAAGIHYEADRLFSGGSTSTSTASIAGTTDDVLYQSVRYGNFAYAIPVSNGAYVVTLRFAELYRTQAGQSVFDVIIEGKEVVSNLDLVAEVGPKVAYDVEIPVQVTDGVLNINFHPNLNHAKVSAIVVAVPVPTAPVPKVVFAVNAGGPAYVDAAGIHYEADRLFSGGSTFKTTAAIAGTADDGLYQSVRYGNFAYAIPVSNGAYVVTLRFAELYRTQAGQSVFDVTIEGKEVVSNLDLVAEVGPKVAYDVEIPVQVTDGVLNINFHPNLNHAKVSAIVVETLGH